MKIGIERNKGDLGEFSTVLLFKILFNIKKT